MDGLEKSKRGRSRTVGLFVRVSVEEKQQIKAQAEALGLTSAELIRRSFHLYAEARLRYRKKQERLKAREAARAQSAKRPSAG